MLTQLPYRKEIVSNNNVNQSDYKTYKPEAKSEGLAKYKRIKASRLQWVSDLNSAIELERQRLARELHDQMGQELVALSLGLHSLKQDLSVTSELKRQFEELQTIIGRLNQQIHDIAWELRPLILDDLGLKDALLVLLEKLSGCASIKTNLQSIELSKLKLSKFAEIELYRVIQEAITNIIKHAKAKNVEVMIVELENTILINVIDDGCGFDISQLNDDSKKKCFGLLGIQERVALLSGALNIITSSGNGTSLKISLPVYA